VANPVFVTEVLKLQDWALTGRLDIVGLDIDGQNLLAASSETLAWK